MWLELLQWKVVTSQGLGKAEEPGSRIGCIPHVHVKPAFKKEDVKNVLPREKIMSSLTPNQSAECVQVVNIGSIFL